MSEFNRLTIVAAVEVIEAFHSHDDMKVLEVQWDIQQYVGSPTSKSGRVAAWAKVAAELNPVVWTEGGQMNLEWALVEQARKAPDHVRTDAHWREFLAGLRFDGFEIVEEESPDPSGRQSIFSDEPATVTTRVLKRMLPDDVPDLDFREAENELEALLKKHDLSVARGHLRQAVSAFSRGEWSSANGELRNFYESYLNEIAVALGYTGHGDGKAKRDFLGSLQPPFLLADYNEWNANNQKSQYVQGLMSRMHPHGGHPGLSEEEDATFRLQVSLITARLFLRRFDQRKNA